MSSHKAVRLDHAYQLTGQTVRIIFNRTTGQLATLTDNQEYILEPCASSAMARRLAAAAGLALEVAQ